MANQLRFELVLHVTVFQKFIKEFTKIKNTKVTIKSERISDTKAFDAFSDRINKKHLCFYRWKGIINSTIRVALKQTLDLANKSIH